MIAETCAVLTAVFPLVLLAFLAERRSLRMKVRKNGFFRRAAEYTAIFAIAGLVFTVIGTQVNGLTGVFAVLAWVQFAATIAGLLCLAMFHIVSAEADEDENVV